MTGYVAGLRTIYLAGLRALGRERASAEVAALRRLAIGRRTASLATLNRRSTASPTVPGGSTGAAQPAPRNPLNQEK